MKAQARNNAGSVRFFMDALEGFPWSRAMVSGANLWQSLFFLALLLRTCMPIAQICNTVARSAYVSDLNTSEELPEDELKTICKGIRALCSSVSIPD